MLGTAHIFMIRLVFYRSLPHREGGGGGSNVTGRKQELRRQLRVVRRNPNLIAALFLLQTSQFQAGNDLDFAALRQLHRKQARLRTKLGHPTSRRDVDSVQTQLGQAEEHGSPQWEKAHRIGARRPVTQSERSATAGSSHVHAIRQRWSPPPRAHHPSDPVETRSHPLAHGRRRRSARRSSPGSPSPRASAWSTDSSPPRPWSGSSTCLARCCTSPRGAGSTG